MATLKITITVESVDNQKIKQKPGRPGFREYFKNIPEFTIPTASEVFPENFRNKCKDRVTLRAFVSNLLAAGFIKTCGRVRLPGRPRSYTCYCGANFESKQEQVERLSANDLDGKVFVIPEKDVSYWKSILNLK